MSAIPPNPIASILQSGYAQGEHARATDADKNAQSEAARQLAGRADAILEIEETDTADTQVHTDAGGLGGQGRFDGSTDDDEARQEDDAAKHDGITRDVDGQLHLDLSA